MNFNKLSSVPIPLLVLVGFILICQGSWMFLDARKHGHKAWLWGFLGLIQFPSYLIIYLIFVRKIFKRKDSEKS